MDNPPKARSSSSPPIALTIAGFDPSSGAGTTADLKTFAAHHLYGISCPTALAVQSTSGVRRVVPIDPQIISETLACLAEDLPIAGIKIGMLANAAIAHSVADFIARSGIPKQHTVLDPVLRSSSGTALLDSSGISVLKHELLPRIGWITPNIDELAVLVDHTGITRDTVPGAAQQLRSMAAAAGNSDLSIVVTGGHLDPPDDYVLTPQDDQGTWVAGHRIETTATHGTGCAFSSALLSLLLHGRSPAEAVSGAKQYVTNALRAAYPIGHGRGPIHHLFNYS